MNRDQQRRNAKEQRRIDARRKARQGARPSQPDLRPRGDAPRRTAVAVPVKRAGLPGWVPWAIVGAVVVLLAVLYFVLDPFGVNSPIEGAKIRTQGNNHIQIQSGQSHQAYLTDPPVSGPHFPVVPQRGIYPTPFVTEYLPHFLEHGGVEVLYNAKAPQDVIDKLQSIVDSELGKGAGQVMFAPRPDMPCEVSVSSWQHISVFNDGNCEDSWLGQQRSPKVDPTNKAWRGHAFDPKSSKDVNYVKTFIERNMCAYDPENICGAGSKGETVQQTPAPGEATATVVLGTATPVPGAQPSPVAPTGTPTPLPGPIALPTGTP